MYVFLIVIPALNFADSVIGIVPSEFAYLIAVSILFAITAIVTAFFAVRHFVQTSKRRMKNGYE